MGGPRRAPIGEVKGERIVHVDDPHVRKKYEAMEAAVKSEAQAKVERAATELNALKSEHREALKRNEVIEAECRRLGNLFGDLSQPAVPAHPKPDQSPELLRMQGEVEKLTQALMLSNDLVRKAKLQAATPLEVVKIEQVIEYRDRTIVRARKGVLAAASAAAFALGLAGAKALPERKPVLAPAAVATPAQVLPKLEVKKAQGVKK